MRDARAAPRRGAMVGALLCAVVMIGLMPRGATAAEVDSVGFDGQTAVAVFQSFDGCIQRSAFVLPMTGRTRDNGTGVTRDATLLIQLVRFDLCGFRWSSRFGQVELGPGDFRVRGDLGAASLRARVELPDWTTGQSAPVDVDLAWRAYGTGLTDASRSHTRSPGGSMEILRGVGRARGAVASGSIRDGGDDYAAGQESASADIASTRSGQVTIVR